MSNLEAWVNIRYTEDTKTARLSQRFGASCPIACREVFIALGIGDSTIALQTEETWRNVSPAAGFNYALTEDVMVYAKYVTGFKAGGFNRIASSAKRVPFDSETTRAVEMGVKSQRWHSRLQINAAAFYQERKDALVIVTDPDMPIAPLGVNAGEIHAKGVELEIQANPVEYLNVSISLGYLSAEFEKSTMGDADLSGQRTSDNFEYSLSSVISYHYPLSDAVELFAFSSYYTAWDGYLSEDNLSKKDEPRTVDLRVGVKTENWNFSGFVENALNDRYINFETDPMTGANHWGLFAPGRTYGIQAVYSFH